MTRDSVDSLQLASGDSAKRWQDLEDQPIPKAADSLR